MRKLTTSLAAIAITISSALPLAAQVNAGAYLAGRHAAMHSDFKEAAQYYAQALSRDTSNFELLDNTALAYLSLGDIDKALPLARMITQKEQRSQIARLVQIAAAANAQDYDALIAREPETTGIGPWVDGLVKAWAYIGKNDLANANAAFDALAQEPGIESFVQYHRALALASIGDFEGADKIFGQGAAGASGQTRRGIFAHAEVLAQMGRHEDALTLIETGFGEGTDPELAQMIAALEAKQDIPFTHVRNARDGLAEVFYTFAAVLRSESAGDYYVLLYARVARYLRPDHIDALLVTASLLENLEQYDLAIKEYKAMPPENPAYHAAELGRADALRRAGKVDQAIEVLENLTQSHGDLSIVHSTLGDRFRGQEKFEEAIAAYSRALDLTPQAAQVRWLLYYSRGIAHERLKDMENSEADFRKSLEINPEQPQVLNYLGYSLVEQKRNLDEALDMIERAVAVTPESGYIVDSLGWVLYRMGRYDEAVAHMERAVELLAVDPIVNDHLGDVYWAVGRKREAEFQWSRALSFIDPEDTSGEANPDRIRRKLEVGLDAVLSEEGAPPLKAANEI